MLHSWFVNSVGQFPDHPALVVAGRTFTYAELDAISRGIAAQLRKETVSRPRVGLLASRSVVAYGAYLAALRIGGVAVPLNAAHPAERTALLARSAGVDVVVADRGQDTGFAADLSLPVARFGEESIEAFVRDADPMDDVEISPQDLAYVLFTSGSTGRPKGVPLRHANLDEFIRYNIGRYDVGPGSRLSQTFHLTFDPSVFDMFVAWGSGATLVVPSEDDLFDPVSFVNRHQLTHWYSVPSVISAAVAAGMLPPDSMPSLRFSLFCGEQLTIEQAHAWADAAPASVLENVYGPTELTVTVCAYRLPRDRSAWPKTVNGTVPIGEIYPHLEYRIDADTGELQVRGSQRFHGYLDPADNAGRFLDPATGKEANPPGPQAYYRTGDKVCVQDGQLVHLGRLDHQVKVFGQRVELEEIERALRVFAGVVDAVVALVERPGRGKELACVYTGEPVPTRQLRERLRDHLPLAVIPKQYVHVERLPLNDRGKVDRAACERILRNEA